MADKEKLVVYGASGHGKVVADIGIQCGRILLGFVDDSAGSLNAGDLLPILGDRSWILKADCSGVSFVLGIGNNETRFTLTQFLLSCGVEIATLISPFAVVSPSAKIGAGSVVMPGAIINAMAEIGEGTIINSGAVIEHDNRIGRYAHVSPNASLGGGVEVGDFAHIGIGATVLPYVRIGRNTTLGAGSVATACMPDGVIAYGVPAKIQRIARSLGTSPPTVAAHEKE